MVLEPLMARARNFAVPAPVSRRHRAGAATSALTTCSFTAANSSDCAALFCLPASSIPFASSNANSCGATVCTYNRVSGNNDGFDFISSEFVHASNCGVQSQDDACALFRS